MTVRAFRWLMFALLIAFMPMHILIGFVPTGSLLIESVQSTLGSVETGRVVWMYVVLSTASVSACAAVAWAIARSVYWLQGRLRDVVGAAAVLLPIIMGALPIYGVSAHGPIQYRSAFSIYSHQYVKGSL